MTRISTAEMYDDKDVITQICKLKDGLNSALGGIIADIDIVNNELVIDWADGESIALPLPSPTGISSIAGSVSSGNLTMTIYMTDGSSHAFTCPLVGFVTLDTEQTITAKKIFSADVEVPAIPAGDDSAVSSFYVNDSTGIMDNNIVHKDGNETILGVKKIDGMLEHPLKNTKIYGSTAGSGNYRLIYRIARPTTTGGADHNTVEVDILGTALYGKMVVSSDKNNGIKGVVMVYTTGFANINVTGIDAFGIYNSNTDEYEVYIKPNPNMWLLYFVNKVLHKDRPADISIITEGDNTTTVVNPDQLPGYSGKTTFKVYLNGALLT